MPGAAVGTVGQLLFYAIAIAMVVALVIYVARILMSMKRPKKEESEKPAAKEAAVPDEPEALLRRAEEEAAGARFVEAIRLCHRAALLGLDRKRVVRFQESFTTGEYRRQLKSHPGEKQEYESIASIFERAFFGRWPASESAFLECRRAAGALATEPAS